MVKTNSLLAKLRGDFPDITFEHGDDFYWSTSTNTIYSATLATTRDQLTLLHEVAHAILGHKEFKRDINLVKIEREAWEYVSSTLAPKYALEKDKDVAEDAIDTYREWLHARSTCPSCAQTGIQTNEALYRCLSCNHDWRVNDARRCGLKRYTVSR